jgi:hypothetical protein
MEVDSREEDKLHRQGHYCVDDDDDQDQRSGELAVLDLHGKVGLVFGQENGIPSLQKRMTYGSEDGVDISDAAGGMITNLLVCRSTGYHCGTQEPS